MIAFHRTNPIDEQVTVWDADPVAVQDQDGPHHADHSFEALIVCDEDWRPCHRAPCDGERSRKIGGAVGGAGIALLLVAVGPVPGWAEALAFWCAVPCLALGAMLLGLISD